MKNVIFLVLIVFCANFYAQEETLLGNGEIEHGGFGGPVVKFTQVKDEIGVLVGGRGGWIINHTFVIGGGGYGLVNNINADASFLGRKPFLEFGYGGVEFEYIIKSDEVIHFSVYTLIGGGTVTYKEKGWDDFGWDWDDWDFNRDEFFVAEPAVNIEVNIASFFRLNAGVSYRFISGLRLDNLGNKDFAGPSANITLKFGKF